LFAVGDAALADGDVVFFFDVGRDHGVEGVDGVDEVVGGDKAGAEAAFADLEKGLKDAWTRSRD